GVTCDLQALDRDVSLVFESTGSVVPEAQRVAHAHRRDDCPKRPIGPVGTEHAVCASPRPTDDEEPAFDIILIHHAVAEHGPRRAREVPVIGQGRPASLSPRLPRKSTYRIISESDDLTVSRDR